MMPFDEQSAAAFLDGKETDFDEGLASDFLENKPAATQKTIASTPEKSALDEMWSGANRYAAGANDVLLNLLGLPGDAMNYVLEKMGAENRVYGSESIRGLGAKLGIGYEKGKEPDSALYKAGEYTGLGLSFLAPALKYGEGALTAAKGGQIVEPSAGVAKGVAQRIAAPFISSPKAALTSELTGSIGAGFGAFYGEKEYGKIGEIIGGLAGGIPASLVGAGIPKTWEYVKKSLFPFTASGARPKAAQRLQSLAETPRTANIISEAQESILAEARIPPAKLTRDRHLIALHNKVLDTDPVLAHKMRLEQQATNALARKELEKIGGKGSIEDTQAHLQGRIDHIKGLINARIDHALIKAKNELAQFEPKIQRNVVNRTVSKQIDTALSDMRAVENEAWGKVRKEVIAPLSKTKTKYQNILADRTETSDPTEIPKFVIEFLGRHERRDGIAVFKQGKFRDAETVKSIHNFRSRLNTVIREEKAKDVPNWNKVRIMNDLNESILDDLADSPTAKEFSEAIEVSRQLNQKFRGGILDTILGHEKTGGRVAPEISLESIKGGPKAAVQIKEVLAASPDSYGMIEELVKLNMQQSGIVDKFGRLSPSAARKYMLKNEDVLDIFPDVRTALRGAVASEEAASRIIATGKGRADQIIKSAENKFVQAKPTRALGSILTGKTPARVMSSIVRKASPDERAGLKSDAIDYLINKGKSGRFDEHDMPILVGNKISNIWKTNKDVLGIPFTKEERGRINIIIETLKKNDDLSELPEIGDIISPANKFINVVVGVMAARAGAKAGAGTSGASLKTASLFTRAAQNIVDKLDVGKAQQLIKDSIQDPELFKALLTENTKPVEWAEAVKIINGWMVAHSISTLQNKPEQQ